MLPWQPHGISMIACYSQVGSSIYSVEVHCQDGEPIYHEDRRLLLNMSIMLLICSQLFLYCTKSP